MTPPKITPRHLWLLTAGTATILATLTGIAHSDDGTATTLGPFNIADSHGLRISQYQLSIDHGGITDFGATLQAQALTGVWDIYRMLIGFIAYLADWVVGMTWITWITGPMNAAARSIHDHLLVPLHMDQLGTAGLMGLLIATAGAIIAIHFLRGNTGRALSEIMISAAIAAAVVGVLAAPVLTFAGNDTEPAAPLRIAQRVGLEVSNLILRNKPADAPIDTTLRPGTPADETVQPVKTGGLLVDTFIRPVHQLVNYGTVLDTTNPKCAQVYDKTLKAGPYDDADKARTMIGRCDHQLETYAESSSWLRIVGLNLYVITAGLLALLILVFAALLVFAVITLTWASLKLIIHAPLAIIPGDTRGPSIRDLVDIAISLFYVVAGIAALSLVIKLVDATLSDTRTAPLQVRFVGIDLILVAGLALLIINYVAHRRGARSLGERIMARIRQSPPRTNASIGQKTAQWLTQPSFTATNPAGASLAMRHGAQLTRRPLNRVTASNGVQLAMVASGLAAGGAGLGLKTLTGTGKAVYGAGRVGFHTGRAGTRLAIHAAHETSKAWQVHNSLRTGAQHATTGHTAVDQVLNHTARAHQHLAGATTRTATAATAGAVLTAGPRTTPQHPQPPTPIARPAAQAAAQPHPGARPRPSQDGRPDTPAAGSAPDPTAGGGRTHRRPPKPAAAQNPVRRNGVLPAATPIRWPAARTAPTRPPDLRRPTGHQTGRRPA